MLMMKQTVLAVAGVPLLSVALTARAEGEARYASRAASAQAIAFDSGVAVQTESMAASALEAREKTWEASERVPFRSDVPKGCILIFR